MNLAMPKLTSPKDPAEADKADPGAKIAPPKPPPPPKPTKYGVQSKVLKQAAKSGTPFCEKCAAAAAAATAALNKGAEKLGDAMAEAKKDADERQRIHEEVQDELARQGISGADPDALKAQRELVKRRDALLKQPKPPSDDPWDQ
jgi:hypothetical protein